MFRARALATQCSGRLGYYGYIGLVGSSDRKRIQTVRFAPDHSSLQIELNNGTLLTVAAGLRHPLSVSIANPLLSPGTAAQVFASGDVVAKVANGGDDSQEA